MKIKWLEDGEIEVCTNYNENTDKYDIEILNVKKDEINNVKIYEDEDRIDNVDIHFENGDIAFCVLKNVFEIIK
ncbi:MAG TPA: hypothetical protein VMZ91_16205 [Candidatus Paceibacterota bacterium]|nr:hypothetical protein [Candidatus Paceibacterota bacterium]